MKNLPVLLALMLTIVSCKDQAKTMNENQSNIAYQTGETSHVENVKYTEQPIWSNDAAIYEVNVRQFSEEGTLNAVTEQLERIKNMGIEILWLMPVHPISESKKKGELGSYYAVGDFRGINPNFGNMADMENLIARAHGLGLKVILDWVPNHTGWDHPWITDHPDYYTQKNGEITDPLDPVTGESRGWTDVADLNYDNPEMRKAMIADMKFWVQQKGVDGFRVDVAHGVPLDFWQQAIPELRAVGGGKNLFMLAEAESPELAGLFNMSYAWRFHHMLPKVLRGEEPLSHIADNVFLFKEQFGSNHYPMMFTSNHDENSWQGTVFERYGDAHQAMAVLTFTIGGMPLVYSGQEAGMNKRLEFFEKDAIEWNNYPLQSFYSRLLHLKKANKALWNGEFGGDLTIVQADNDKEIYSYLRKKDNNQVFVAINFTDRTAGLNWPFEHDGSWKLEMGETLPTNDGQTLLPKFGYAVWVKK